MELFRRLHAGGQTILLVTHDEDVRAPPIGSCACGTVGGVGRRPR